MSFKSAIVLSVFGALSFETSLYAASCTLKQRQKLMLYSDYIGRHYDDLRDAELKKNVKIVRKKTLDSYFKKGGKIVAGCRESDLETMSLLWDRIKLMYDQKNIPSEKFYKSFKDYRKVLLSHLDLKELVPRKRPDLDEGEKVYQNTCKHCHGESGEPEPKIVKNLSSPPPNFTSKKFLKSSSPLHVYNSITFGIEHTSMASFSALPDDDRRNVAAYVFTLNKTDQQQKVQTNFDFHWKQGIYMSDWDILLFLKRHKVKMGDMSHVLAHVRYLKTFSKPKKPDQETLEFLAKLKMEIENARDYLDKEEYRQAKQRMLKAHFKYFSPIENQLRTKGYSSIVNSFEKQLQSFLNMFSTEAQTKSGLLEALSHILGSVEILFSRVQINKTQT